MAKIIALCGKICSGKSTYAEKIKHEYNAVILSVDTLMLMLFDENLGDKHEEIFEKSKQYLWKMAKIIIAADTNVILDFGLWTRCDRLETIDHFRCDEIQIEIHYINTPLELIRRNVKKRNLFKDEFTYYIDETILDKCLNGFEEPDENEIDLEIKITAEF